MADLYRRMPNFFEEKPNLRVLRFWSSFTNTHQAGEHVMSDS